jgi:hypothetical protein
MFHRCFDYSHMAEGRISKLWFSLRVLCVFVVNHPWAVRDSPGPKQAAAIEWMAAAGGDDIIQDI